MWLTLILLGMLIAITIRQAMQGFFSALIMAVLTVCGAAAALGTFEWVAANWVAPFFLPSYAWAISLAVLFGVPVSILYTVFAVVVKRSCLLPAWADRVGGGICGFVSAMIIVGITAISLQMLPFDQGRVLGFARFDAIGPETEADAAAEATDEHGLLVPADGFTVTLASLLSSGVFSTEDSFYQSHPDLLRTVGWVGAAPTMVSRFAAPGSITVTATESVPYVYNMTQGDTRSKGPATYEPEPPQGGMEFRMVRVQLREGARDEHRSHFFTLRQFRLVGHERNETALTQYHPIAVQQADATDPTNRHIRSVKRAAFIPVFDEVYAPRDAKSNTVEIVFELPTGFQPSFLEYKGAARVAVSFEQRPARAGETRAAPATPPAERTATREPAEPAAAPPVEASASGRRPRAPRSEPETAVERPRRGNVRGVAPTDEGSHFGDELPLTLTDYRRLQNTEIERGALKDGHLVAEVDQQEDGADNPVNKLAVPEDKRLLHLSIQKLQSRSGLGKAISFAVETLQNYTVMDASGNQYLVCGKYARADVEGVDVFEVVYSSEPSGRIGGLGKFDRIDEKRDLKPQDNLVLLFLVEPGAEIVSFSSGGAGTSGEDLVSENLVAPK